MEWMAYSEVEPFGSWVNEYHVARMSSILVNVARGFSHKKGDTPNWATIPEFMPPWSDLFPKPKQKEQSVEEMKTALMHIAKVQNSKFKKLDNKRPPKKRAQK